MEFTANNIYSVNINCILFLANSEQHLQLRFKLVLALNKVIAKTKYKLINTNKSLKKIENIS